MGKVRTEEWGRCGQRSGEGEDRGVRKMIGQRSG